jgi:NADP-dependent 3-hydroxy acid dehydrogenase YdfG
MSEETNKKTALVTGATSGFGLAIAHRLAAAGYRLIITGRRAERLNETAGKLRVEYGVDMLPLVFDVRDRSAVEKTISSLPEKWSQINLLVNNAGLALGKATLPNGDPEDWDTMLDTNVKGLLYVTRAVLPYLRNSQGGAHIVNIGSIAGTEVYPGGNVYCASKHAVNAITKALRQELLPEGIRVSQIRPGLAETEFSLVRFKGDTAKAGDVYKGYEALAANDIADLLMYIVNAPAHVCINDVEITPTAQANAGMLHKEG